MNDAFSKYGEAEGQYRYSSSIPFMKSSEGNEPSLYFDLCRLSITILDELRDKYEDDIDENYTDDIVTKYDNLMEFLKYTTTDINGNRLDKDDDDFSLYINISRTAKNSLPSDIIVKDYFKDYRVKKSNFPLKSCYTLSSKNKEKSTEEKKPKKNRRNKKK